MEDKTKALYSMIKRLQDGEDLQAVRQDFVDQFQSVSVHDIIDAEKQLIAKGTAVQEVQRLCDLHSALFHGKTEAEVYREEERVRTPYLIQILKDENLELLKRIKALNNALELDKSEEIEKKLLDLKQLKKHYGKKEELIMPYLYAVGIEGPSQVMWGVDDEILKELSKILRTKAFDPHTIQALLDRMKEMVFKEEKILFPLAIDHMKPEDWLETYADIQEFGYAWLEDVPVWEQGEEWKKEHAYTPESIKISLPNGELSLSQLVEIFQYLPIDLTFIDENDQLRFFTNEGKVFSRPHSALNRKVFDCHPPQLIPVVQDMLETFKAKKNDRVERWIPNPERPVKVVYQALYDSQDRYIGTLEMVQSFEHEKNILRSFQTDPKEL